MQKNLPILILAMLFIFSCNRAEQKDAKAKCSFQFEIEAHSGDSYHYNSKTGRLKKLINPFKEKPIYADTVVFISQKNLCYLMSLCQLHHIFKYPNEFKPESRGTIIPQPSYHVKFTIDTLTKNIDWTNNTFSSTKEAVNLRKILNVIDSLILSSPEYQGLPKQHYRFL